MSLDPKLQVAPYQMRMELFTEHHRIAGEITTTFLRSNGVVNTASQHLYLSRVSAVNLLKPNAVPVESGVARIVKESIVVVMSSEELDAEIRLRSARVYSRSELMQLRVLLGLGNYEVQGDLHLNQALDIETVLLNREETFIGITNASIIYLPDPGLKFAASTVLFNKNRVDFVCSGAP